MNAQAGAAAHRPAALSTLEAGPVRLPLDEAGLLDYLLTALPPGSLPRSCVLAGLRQFGHGQSNPTYLALLASADAPERVVSRLVVRRKPPGKILESAHAVEREYAAISALAGAVPVPRAMVLCSDASVLGTPFYVMEHACGHVYLDPNLPSLRPGVRQHVYAQMASTLARLHSVDPQKVDLHGFGTAPNYCARQVKRWARQYAASTAQPMQEVAGLIAWLSSNVPAADADLGTGAVCHGDYRLDNLVVDEADGFKVKAVLDWELSTLGNPWADVAYNCLPYHLPSDNERLPALSLPLPAGVPDEATYLGWYCAARGLAGPPTPREWAFYLALSLFRLLAILAGVQARAKAGNASSASAAALASDDTIAALAGAACSIIARAERGAGPAPAALAGGVPAAGSSNAACSEPAAGPGGFAVSGLSVRVRALRGRLQAFIDTHVLPAEAAFEEHAQSDRRWTVLPLMEELKAKARARQAENHSSEIQDAKA